MSRFTEAINAEPTKPNKGPSCSVGKFIETLDGEDLEDFNRLFEEYGQGERTMTSISRILQRVGVELAANRLTWHYRGQCKCPR